MPKSKPYDQTRQLRLAVVGRPNVGKSSLINCILGDQRLLVSDIPGTTRDAVDTIFSVDEKQYVFIDTAGIRRKKNVREKLEKFSIIKALRSLNQCDIALLVLDASEGVIDQDVRIAGYVAERGRACVVLLNKWDLIEEKNATTADQHIKHVRERMKFLSFAPMFTISALTGQRAFKIFEWIAPIYEQYTTRVGTGQLNRLMEGIVSHREPALHRGKQIKFYYCTQTSIAPPTFVCFVNFPEGIHFSYKRYVSNRIREALGLDMTPFRVLFRKRKRK